MKTIDSKYTIEKPDRLISYYKKNITFFVFIIILGVAYNIGMILPPLFSGKMIDQMSSLDDRNNILQFEILVIVFVFSTLAVQIIRIFERFFIRKFAIRSRIQMKMALFNTILRMDDDKVENDKIGSILTKGLADVDSTIVGLRKLSTEMFDTIVVFIVYFIYLIFYDYEITLISMAFVLSGVIFAFLMRKRVYEHSKDAALYFSKLSQTTLENVSKQRLFRRYGLEEKNLENYKEELEIYNKKIIKANVLQIAINPVAYVISLAALFVIVTMGIDNIVTKQAVFVRNDLLTGEVWTIGIFSTYIATFLRLASKASNTANLFSTIQKSFASYFKVKPYLESYREYEQNVAINEDDKLCFTNYTLPIGSNKFINDFTMDCKLGEVILISSGVATGKTTFANSFINKMNYRGSLKVFGKELKEYKNKELDGTISVISHKNFMFNDTIKNNILLGREEEVWPLLNDVELTKMLTKFDRGIDSKLQTDSYTLSEGQKKKISIAREFVKQKRLIIFDEVFSTLKGEDAKTILTALKKRCASTSILLVISNHKALEQVADKVITINDSEYSIEVKYE